MHKKGKLELYTLDELTDKFIGKRGTKRREDFEYELKLEFLGEAIKQTRRKRKLTQGQLGKLVGVQKSQISKLENNLTNARFDTIMKVFNALDSRIHFTIKLSRRKFKI
ncbi:MAG TPA: helix-turn-helix transcriptional regulator [Ignavibacteria bacterium]|nr:helix-turn-helix transcriptional regulator [Ignavibacteria bacterium]HRE09816.1 helix-turn-helix transcriptional regulator [Ignavibacteria bacterium]HRF66489.1 helix-turn-helix transcriptional regulator [Ignavibacteria bacterium]HRJ03621.1 helix-turn-helix transcriptional regulator [Ignavibacteria bacterium]HRJ84305.1 helix-turn-helix transcriptional regulator [Ignavibacteria bacterium]